MVDRLYENRRDVVVVTGEGGMGAAIAHRLGSGRTLLVADASTEQLDRVVEALCDEGHAARRVVTDVSDQESLAKLANAVAEIDEDVAEIERALTSISYLVGRARQHDRLMALAGVSLDRAAAALLRQIADSGPLRPGELANLLAVEASHVTRQAQQLHKAGYVTRIADPDDRRAQRIQLTPAGQEAMDRIRDASRRGIQMALAGWSPGERRQLASLFQRMVDDFVSHAEDAVPELAATAHIA